ncbi:MAG: GvpL/GvpF family gas vesicle protein [Gammaproteobacteria bacterium]|nr:GvpL/GvpF family gas vesicle protein [Gammaproteobacteria bacterium]
MSLYLYGILFKESAEEIHFGPIGFDEGEVKGIPAGKLMAVIGPPPEGDLKTKPKEALVRLLLLHQTTVEKVMKRSFILPFKFGSTLASPSEIILLLHNAYPLLFSIAERVKECAEMNVMATWNVEATLKEMAEKDPEILARKKEAERGSIDRSFVGMLLAHGLKKKAGELQRKAMDVLVPHAIAWTKHEEMNDEMILNCSFLIQNKLEENFFACLHEFDRSLEGRLNFKCIGPLPPYSFSTIAIKRFDPEQVTQAARLFGLTGQVEAAQVKRTYKKLARKKHPDLNPGIASKEFEELNQAYQLLKDYLQEGQQSLERSSITDYLHLEILGALNRNEKSPCT